MSAPHSHLQRPVVVFVHLPKTGGTTLKWIITEQLGADRVFDVRRGPIRNRLEELAQMSPQERGRYDAVIGHMPFGVGRLLERPCLYVTLLRDPVERVVSDYFFVRRAQDHPLHAKIVSGQLDLAEFAATHVDNMMVRRLDDFDLLGSESYWVERRREPASGDMLEQALSNLRDCHVVGLCERLEDSVFLMCRKLGWPLRPVPVLNRTDERPSLDRIDPAVLETIRGRSVADRALYDAARSRFEAEWDRISAWNRRRAAVHRWLQQRARRGRRLLAGKWRHLAQRFS